MAGPTPYERRQIESVLPPPNWAIDRGAALVMLPRADVFERVHAAAIAPALAKNGLNVADVRIVFDDQSPVADAMVALTTTQLIIADASGLNGAVLYLLGVAHVLGRSPILLKQRDIELPFDLHRLRIIDYTVSSAGLLLLRHDLDRAVRIFLSATD